MTSIDAGSTAMCRWIKGGSGAGDSIRALLERSDPNAAERGRSEAGDWKIGPWRKRWRNVRATAPQSAGRNQKKAGPMGPALDECVVGRYFFTASFTACFASLANSLAFSTASLAIFLDSSAV